MKTCREATGKQREAHPDQAERLIVGGVVALAFGVIYNEVVDYWSTHNGDRSAISALQVVVGVAFTVLIAGIVLPAWVLLHLFYFFVLTGGPMIIGAWKRDKANDDFWRSHVRGGSGKE